MRKLLSCISVYLILASAFSGSIARTSIVLHGASSVLHRYPLPNATEVSPGTNIGIRLATQYASELVKPGDIRVEGSKSGLHDVGIDFSHDRQTLIIHPISAFFYNEEVHVLVNTRLIDGSSIIDTFNFTTMIREIPNTPVITDEIQPTRMNLFNSLNISGEDELPPMKVTVDDGATPGVIYIANFHITVDDTLSFLFNLDKHGNVIKKK